MKSGVLSSGVKALREAAPIMSRKLRVEFVGACYHVLNRGYREHLRDAAGVEAKLGCKAIGRFSCGWAIGSPAFRARLNEELVAQSSVQERFELLGADRAAHVAARAELGEK